MKSLQTWVQVNEIDLAAMIHEESMIVHSVYANNTVEARCTVHIKDPDGNVWEGERVIKIKMRRLRQ